MDKHPPSEQWRRSLLFVMDLIGFVAAFNLAYSLRLSVFAPYEVMSSLVLLFASVDLFFLYLFDLYQTDAQTPLWRKPLQTVGAIGLATTVIVLIAYLIGSVQFTGVIGRGVLIGAQVLFGFWAAGLRFLVSRWVRETSQQSRFLVLGTDENLCSFVKDLASSKLAGNFSLLTPSESQDPIKLTSVGSRTGSRSVLSVERLGCWQDLERYAKEPWSGIIVCAGNQLTEPLVEALMDFRLRGVRVVDLADFYERTWSKVPVFYLQRSWFAMAQGFQLLHNPIGLRLKRIFDVIGSTILMILVAPIVLLAAFLVKLESKGATLYSQIRVGENGRLFRVYKLRSMRSDAEKHGAQWSVVGDHRITRVGAVIRATRIDELPQLINVLRGEMSFIGPRPERPEFTKLLEQDIPFYNLRHLLRPGVTGWAQVMYPYGASTDDAREKLQYELYYIKNYSLLLDAAILLKTIRVVLFGQGR